MIDVEGLTKRYGEKVVVDDLSFSARPGVVTGFLGPNGAGKSTTMRMLLALDRPTAGRTRFAGREYRTLDEPLRHVGAVLEADAFHPARSARNHLRVAAHSNGLPVSRVDEVLEQVGLASVAAKRVGTYSLGMRQRLGIAAALLGHPPVLLFDEPVNGLDADGVRWVRQLLRRLAGEGRTVLVSSHLLGEMQQTADHLIVIARGRLIADASMQDLIAASGASTIRVRTDEEGALADALAARGALVERTSDGVLEVSGASTEDIGRVAHAAGLVVLELVEVPSSLEQAYLELTAETLEYSAADAGRPTWR